MAKTGGKDGLAPQKNYFINQAHQQVTNRAARQGQIEAQRFEGGVHSKTMDDDGESICRSRSKLVVTCLCAWLIIQYFNSVLLEK